MRRLAGIILIAVGVFALTLGVMLRFVVVDRLALAPLDPDMESVARGTNMTVFYPSSLSDPSIPRQRTDATVTARRLVSGKLDAPEVKVNGNVALWRVGLVLEDDRSILVNAVEQWVCVDRRTGESVLPCRDQKIDDGTTIDTAPNATGLNYKFPFGTERRNYTYYDVSLKAAPPIRYDGEEKINGLDTYRFVQVIDPVKLDDREVPGDLVGLEKGTSVTTGRYYQNQRTLWVEPYTGIIVKGQEHVRQVLRTPDGRDGLVVLAGTFTLTPQTVQANVEAATANGEKIRLLSETGPMVAWALGWVFVVVGLILSVPSARRVERFRHRNRSAPTEVLEREAVG
jgi:Porin PorA